MSYMYDLSKPWKHMKTKDSLSSGLFSEDHASFSHFSAQHKSAFSRSLLQHNKKCML